MNNRLTAITLTRDESRIVGKSATGYMDLDPAELLIDSSYQRPLDERRAKRLAESWNDLLCDALRVNLRADGSTYVVDGQHRQGAALLARRPTVPCLVHDGLTVEQEAALFYLLQSNRTAPTYAAGMKARLAAGEPTAQAVKQITDRLGVNLNLTGGGKRVKSVRTLQAIAVAERIVKDGGESLLARCLAVLVGAWPDDTEALSQDVLMGAAILLSQPGINVDDTRLIEKLTPMLPAKLIRAGKVAKEQAGTPAGLYIARELAKAYNRNLIRNRLNVDAIQLQRGILAAGNADGAGGRRWESSPQKVANSNLLNTLRTAPTKKA